MSTEPRAARISDGVALTLLLAAIALAPIPLGSEAPWARAVVFTLVAAATVVWVVGGVIRGSLCVPRSWVLVFVAAFFLLGLLQIMPLPQSILGMISPEAKEMRSEALGIDGVVGSAPLSLQPYATRAALFRYATCALAFVVLASLVRTKKTIAWVAAILLAAALFQVVYAVAEHMSGGTNVFWVRKSFYQHTFTGTFFNKNHFAGFIEMVLPLAVGLVMTVEGGATTFRAQSLAQKLIVTLGSPEAQKRIILAVPVLLLGVGVAMSLSRAGVVCSLIALSALAVFAVFNFSGRSSRTLLLILIGVGCVVLVVASGPVIARFEEGFRGKMSSVYARLDMLRSSTGLIRDFPVLGTGLGTLMYVFGPYQSEHLGNIHVDYLTNDWAQITCEAGALGLLVVGGGLLFFVGVTLRTAAHRRDRFCKWVAIGALGGVFAMMLHSFADFNLIRTTSNTLLFAALLALAHSAAHSHRESAEGERSSGHARLRLGTLSLRIVVGLALLCALFALMDRQADVAHADISYNRYLHYADKHNYGGRHTGRIRLAGMYHFLPLPPLPREPLKAAEAELKRARRLDPSNPLYAHAAGRHRMEEIEHLIVAVARTIVYEILPQRAQAIENTDPEGFQQLQDTYRRGAQTRLADDTRTRQLLEEAESAFRTAVRLAPTVPRYHLSLAECLELRARLDADLDPDGSEATRRMARRELGRAEYFGRNVPYIIYGVAKVFLDDALGFGGEEGAQDIARAVELLRRAIRCAPATLALNAYHLLTRRGIDHDGLFDATPETVRAYRYLCKFLWAKKDWENVCRALTKLDDLVRVTRPDAFLDPTDTHRLEPELRGEPSVREERIPPGFSWASEDAPTEELQLDIAEKQVTVLGLLGKWAERKDALEQHARLLDRRLADVIAAAAERFQQGQFDQAMREYQEALDLSPHNIDALIGMAGTTSVPSVRSAAPFAADPLSCLFRLVTNNDSLTVEQCDKVISLLRELRPEAEEDQLVSEFVECVAGLLQAGEGAPSKSLTVALQQLHKLQSSVDGTLRRWRQRHLIWYYLGVGYEAKGEEETALKMYKNVLGDVPDHRPSLERLAVLAPEVSDATDAQQYSRRLADLRPDRPCTIAFGGRLRLRGYSVRTDHGGQIWYYWEFLESLPPAYKAYTYFLDDAWKIRRVDGSRPIAALGRCGEMVIEKRPLKGIPEEAVYLGVTLFAAEPPQDWPKHLQRDGGRGLARVRLDRRPVAPE